MEIKKTEILQEGWLHFRRLHCREGFIDIWSGDEVEDPNQDTQSEDSGFYITSWYRLNGEGKWFNKKEFFDILSCLELGTEKSAQDIWKMALTKNT